MSGVVRAAGYLALLATPAALLAATVWTGPRPTVAVGIEGLVVLGGSVTAALERDRAFERMDGLDVGRREALDVLAVVAGAVFTYLLSVRVGLGPVVASATVGLFVGLAAPSVAVPAYCGSFVGMASPAVVPGVESLAVAGAVAGLAFVATEGTFAGFGGKLGTLALFGCATAMALPSVSYATGDPIPWARALVVVPVAVAAAVATVALSVRLELGAVVGSALVGVVAGVGFPVALPETGPVLAAAAFCASFVGMSTTERLDGELHVLLAGALSGLVFLAVAPAFAGAGGKLGTVAFLACLSSAGVREVLDRGAPTPSWRSRTDERRRP